MATADRNAFLSRIFNDPKHYPYGFARSGDFSISESQALSHFGALFHALASGNLAPSTDLDQDFLNVIAGEQPAQSVAEKAWMKYQTRIHRQRQGSIYGFNKPSLGDKIDDDDSSDSDIDEDSSLDIED